MAIKQKDGPTIVKKYTVDYNPATFNEHIDERFLEVTAEELLERVRPKTFSFLPDEKFITVDTETFYTGVASNRLPSKVVRRWVKQKSKYIPTDFPFCISICDGSYAFVVYDTLENGFKEFKKLIPFLTDSSISKIFHNAGYDFHMLANAQIDLKGRVHDTMFISKLVRADAFTHGLLDISTELQKRGVDTVTMFEHMVSSYKSKYHITDYRQIPRVLMTQYTCGDVWNTMKVFEDNYPKLAENGLTALYKVESEMLMVAYRMERMGVKLDLEYEHEIIPELIAEADAAEKEIYEAAGTTFNINSSAQIEVVLKKMGYGHLITYNRPTAGMLEKGITKGSAKFDKDEMARLEDEGVPLVSKIQEYKRAEKLLNTFARKLYEMRDFNGFVHCNFNTIEAKTGRFSISAPSMQNMPRRKDSRIRGAFIAPEGFTQYDFDFKSQETIILAHYSRAQFLLDGILEGKDAHRVTAAIIYTKPIEDVTDDERGDAKSVGFAVVYGAGPSKVATMTEKSLTEAKYIMKIYMKNLPEVDLFIKTANKVMKEKRRVKSIMGRQIYAERGREYACVNYVIQSSAADSTKTRMVEIYKFLKANNYKTYMTLQVHDSLLQCVANDEVDFILGYLKWLQTERELFRVPITVDVDRCHPTWRTKEKTKTEAVEPPADQLERMRVYDIWSEGLL